MDKVVRVKPLALIVNTNELTVKEKVQVIVNLLRSREYEVLSYRELCDGAWFIDITIPTSERVPVLIAVNGVFRYPFEQLEVHELEDHIAYLKLLTDSLGGRGDKTC